MFLSWTRGTHEPPGQQGGRRRVMSQRADRSQQICEQLGNDNAQTPGKMGGVGPTRKQDESTR